MYIRKNCIVNVNPFLPFTGCYGQSDLNIHYLTQISGWVSIRISLKYRYITEEPLKFKFEKVVNPKAFTVE